MTLCSACVELKLHKHCTAVCILHSVAVKLKKFFCRFSNKCNLPNKEQCFL